MEVDIGFMYVFFVIDHMLPVPEENVFGCVTTVICMQKLDDLLEKKNENCDRYLCTDLISDNHQSPT